jgi:hypothetical protein
MSANIDQQQNITLYAPKSNVLIAIFLGFCLPLGIMLPFLLGWQFPILLSSLFLIVSGIAFLILAWKMIHRPALIINAKGIFSLHPLLRTDIQWEEIASIYRINRRRNGAVFAVDISPAGLLSFSSRQSKSPPHVLDTSMPQLALGIPQSNLPIPVDHLLSQIRAQFAEQIAYYHIDLDDGQEES